MSPETLVSGQQGKLRKFAGVTPVERDLRVRGAEVTVLLRALVQWACREKHKYSINAG